MKDMQSVRQGVHVAEDGPRLAVRASGTGTPAPLVLLFTVPVALFSAGGLVFVLVTRAGVGPVLLCATVLLAFVWMARSALEQSDVTYVLDREAGLVLRNGRPLLRLSAVESFGVSHHEGDGWSCYRLAAKTREGVVTLEEVRSPTGDTFAAASAGDAERVAAVARRVAEFAGKAYSPEL